MAVRARALCVALAVAFSCTSAARGQGAAVTLMRPVGVAYDAAGDLFIADSNRNQVLEISIAGAMSVVAGNGTQGFAGDGGPASAAELNAPMAVAVGANGTLYIADTGNQRIRAVSGGTITTFAGSGARGFGGEGGAAKTAALNRPVALAIDGSGALLICDQGNERVRRISDGTIETIAGNGTQGYGGDGGQATAADLNEPSGVAVSADGRVFIADTGNQRVRVVGSTGVISTFAGTGVAGFSGDGGPAAAARLNRPVGLALDDVDELFIADENNHRLRRVGSDGMIATIAGNGVQGAAADGSGATSSPENLPVGVAVSGFGWPVIADANDGSVRLVFSDGKLYVPASMSARRTTITAAASNAVYGQVRSSAKVAGNPGMPQGIVQLLDGATPVASGAVANGAATIPLPMLGAGAHALTALYEGDGLHPASSTAATVVVSPAPLTTSATAATISYGAPLPALTGTLSGVLPQDQVSVTAVFTATASPTSGVGSYPITAALTGSASGNYTLSMNANSGVLTIVPATTIAALTQPPAAYAGLPLQLNATVASTTSGVPTGSVEFLDGGSVVATAPLVNGSASAVDLSLASGEHDFSVSYSGDTNFRASVSGNVLEAVAAMPDFSVATSGSAQQTVVAGSQATFAFSIASLGAPFTGAVTMSASGLPAGASVSFSPPTVVPGASSVPVTMTVTTTSLSANLRGALPEVALGLAGVIFVFARRRRGLMARLLALIILSGMFGVSGCGARTASESVLPTHNYSIVVKATGTNLAGSMVEHTVGITLTVQ